MEKSSLLRQMLKRVRVVKFDDYFHSFPIEVPEIVGSEILAFDFASGGSDSQDHMSESDASVVTIPSSKFTSSQKVEPKQLAVAIDVGFQGVA